MKLVWRALALQRVTGEDTVVAVAAAVVAELRDEVRSPPQDSETILGVTKTQ